MSSAGGYVAPHAANGQFTFTNQAEATDVALPAAPGTDEAATGAALEAEIAIYQASKASIELLSVKFAAQTILKDHPAATHLQLGPSDQTYGEMVPEAVLDADGEVLADDYDDFDSYGDAISNLHEDGDWTAYCDDTGHLNLQNAAAISLDQIGSTAGSHTVTAPADEHARTRAAADQAVAAVAQAMNRASEIEAQLMQGRLGSDPSVRAGYLGQIAAMRRKAERQYLADLEAALGIGPGRR